MLDLMRLQTFLHAAENLSFSTAARYMQLSQPTVSHHIKALEDELGVELFDRSGGGLRLTESGQLLLMHARKLIRYAVELEQMMQSVHDEVLGHIRIACSTTTGTYILPLFAARFRCKHAGVCISILRCTPECVVSRLLEAEANLGVVSYDTGGLVGLETQEFFRDHIILIVPAEHPWAACERIEPGDLLGQPFLMREETSGTRRVVLAELCKYDIVPEDMNIFMELGSPEAIVRTVEAGFGVSFVSWSSAHAALKRGTVAEVRVAGFNLHRPVYLVRKDIHEANRAVEAFWGFVRDPLNLDLLRIAEQ